MRVSPSPRLCPSTRPRVSSATPAVTSTAPRASGLGTGWPGTYGSLRQPKNSAASPIGTFTRNTQCQLAATSTPPTTGPSAAASPPTAVQARTEWARRSGAAVASTRLRDVGVTSAAPAAWNTRKTINSPVLCAVAHRAEATTNTATPTRKPSWRG